MGDALSVLLPAVVPPSLAPPPAPECVIPTGDIATVQSVQAQIRSADLEMVSGDVSSLVSAINNGHVALQTITDVGPLVPGFLTVDEIAANGLQGVASQGCTRYAGPSVASDVTLTLVVPTSSGGQAQELRCRGENRRCMRFWGCASDYCALQCMGSGPQFWVIPQNGVECRIGGVVMVPSLQNQCFDENRLCGVCQ